MITVAMLAKIRRMFHREHLSVRQISHRTGFSRNTIGRWLKQHAGVVDPQYPAREVVTKLDAYALLLGWS